MARKRNDEPPANTNTAWDEQSLLNLPVEKLREVARELNFAVSETSKEEELIKAILKAQEDAVNSQDGKNKQDTGNDKPPATTNKGSEDNPEGIGTIRVKNEKCKNAKRFLGNGKLVEFDADGIAEIEANQAGRLLNIPGY